jgi:hypothetical protein
MEFHEIFLGIPSSTSVQWNCMENFMEFHGISLHFSSTFDGFFS